MITGNFGPILILAPHTDDGELGCGATISKYIAENREVYYAAFSTADDSVPEGLPKNILEIEVKNATRILGIRSDHLIIYKYQVRKLNYIRQEILEELVKLRAQINPEIVFIPSPNDLHQDHHTVSIEALRAFKKNCILGYELPWNNISFQTQAFSKVSRESVEMKCKALQAYESQKNRDYTSPEFIFSLAKMRGVQIGCDFAEAFEVIRWII